jgi:hypothetical protein
MEGTVELEKIQLDPDIQTCCPCAQIDYLASSVWKHNTCIGKCDSKSGTARNRQWGMFPSLRRDVSIVQGPDIYVYPIVLDQVFSGFILETEGARFHWEKWRQEHSHSSPQTTSGHQM